MSNEKGNRRQRYHREIRDWVENLTEAQIWTWVGAPRPGVTHPTVELVRARYSAIRKPGDLTYRSLVDAVERGLAVPAAFADLGLLDG
jgi:hypothetical protein